MFSFSGTKYLAKSIARSYILCKNPVLIYFDSSKDVTIQCNAFQKGGGASLMQDEKSNTYSSQEFGRIVLSRQLESLIETDEIRKHTHYAGLM